MGLDAEHNATDADGIRALYEVLLGRTLTDTDLEVWDGASARDVGAAILVSPEYLLRVKALGGGGESTTLPALRLIETHGMADLSQPAAVAPSPALPALPFDAIDDQLGSPSIRTVGGYAVALADELARRGHTKVTAGLPCGPDEASDVLVTTGPSDLGVLAQVRPDVVAPVQRAVVPHEIAAEDAPPDAARSIDDARAALHQLGFAEVLRVFRIPHGGQTITIDVSDLIPPEGFHAVRPITDVEPPRSTWLVTNRVPFAEGM